MRIFFRILIMGLAVASCQKPATPDVSDQPSPALRLPDYSAAHDPLRAQNFAGLEFSGSVVVWGDNAAPQAIETVLQAATDMRHRKADLKRFTEVNIKPLRGQIPALRANLAQAEHEADSNKDDLATVAGYAAAWFDSTMTNWIQATFITAEQRQNADEVFAAYCEAKIWELAADQTFVQALYRTVPTPFQICQNYYDVHGFLSESVDVCAPDAAGKNYFPCLWQEGVLRTRFFSGRYSSEQSAKILAWTVPTAEEESILQNLLRDPEQSQLVRIGIMDQRRIPPLGADRYLFRPITGTPRPSPDLPIAHASPMMVIRAVEYGPLADTPESLTMFAWAAQSDFGRIDDDGTERLKTFYKDIETLGEREIGTPSVNDYRFHEILGEKTEPAGYQFAKQRETLKFIFDNRSPADKEKIAKLAAHLQARQGALRDMESTAATSYLEPLADSMELSAKAASADGVSSGLWVSSLLSIKVDGPILVTRFSLDAQSPGFAKGCLDHEELVSVACPDHSQNAEVVHDQTSGALRIRIPLQDPDAFGFRLYGDDVASTSEAFSHIDPDSVTGTYMRLELFPNTVDGILVYYSGKLFIEDIDAGILYEGAVNLLEDI